MELSVHVDLTLYNSGSRSFCSSMKRNSSQKEALGMTMDRRWPATMPCIAVLIVLILMATSCYGKSSAVEIDKNNSRDIFTGEWMVML